MASGFIILLAPLIIFFSCAHKSTITSLQNGLSRKWTVGVVKGQIVHTKKFAPIEISTEMECFGEKSDGTQWTETKNVPTRFSIVRSNSKEITYSLVTEQQTLIFPEVKPMACAYFLKLDGPHPNGGMGSGRLPIAGELPANGMPEMELKKLLDNQNLHLEISKSLSGWPVISH